MGVFGMGQSGAFYKADNLEKAPRECIFLVNKQYGYKF